MNVPGLEGYNWAVWLIGVVVFGLAILALVVASIRAARRPPAPHSAAERLRRETPPAPEVEVKLRELDPLKEHGQISETEYEKHRAEVLAGK